jgi:hypothetical protein
MTECRLAEDGKMSKGRMEAFSDGVIAIIITLHGRDSVLATAVGRDFKGKVSIVL